MWYYHDNCVWHWWSSQEEPQQKPKLVQFFVAAAIMATFMAIQGKYIMTSLGL